jgi:hypothetical protein
MLQPLFKTYVYLEDRMADNAKITLSAKELELVCNTDWIFTKHIIIQKVYQLFGDIIPGLENAWALTYDCLAKEIFNKRAKISRGENYQLLPYVMLDYPRFFEKNDSFAIRTFFWWGHFFSITLQLSGKYKVQFEKKLLQNFNFLRQNNYWVCVNETPWEHHFSNSNYLPVKDLTEEQFSIILTREPFVKLAKKIPLHLWEIVPEFLINTYGEMIQLIKTV